MIDSAVQAPSEAAAADVNHPHITDNTGNNSNINSNNTNDISNNENALDSDSEVEVPDDSNELDEDALLANESTPIKPKQSNKSMNHHNNNLNQSEAGDNALDRLDYLLMKTEQFSALVKPKSSTTQSHPTSASKRTVDEKHKENLEDAELLRNEQIDIDQSDTVLQAYKNPDCVKAVMRDYQIEALNWMLRLHHGKINGM